MIDCQCSGRRWPSGQLKKPGPVASTPNHLSSSSHIHLSPNPSNTQNHTSLRLFVLRLFPPPSRKRPALLAFSPTDRASSPSPPPIRASACFPEATPDNTMAPQQPDEAHHKKVNLTYVPPRKAPRRSRGNCVMCSQLTFVVVDSDPSGAEIKHVRTTLPACPTISLDF